MTRRQKFFPALPGIGRGREPDSPEGATLSKSEPAKPQAWHAVRASSFADPADVAAFKKCKAGGQSDIKCFAAGDNGVGAWGHLTAQETSPMCALPREIWRLAGKTGGAKVQVRYRGVIVDGILGDTMPALRNIKNGAGIDLNPAFAKGLRLKPPFLVSGVEWRWA